MNKRSLIIEQRGLFLGKENDYMDQVKQVLIANGEMNIVSVEGEEELLEMCYTYEPMLIYMELDLKNINTAIKASAVCKYRQAVSIGLAPADNESFRRLVNEQVLSDIVVRSGEPRKDGFDILRSYKINTKYGVNLKTLTGKMPLVTELIWNDYSREEIRQRHSISKRLDRLGVKRELAGHKYLIAAIALQSATTSAPEPKKIYERVAEYYDTTPLAVEKAIRYAVETAWTIGDIEYQQRTFGMTVDPEKGKPTNAEFIARLAIEY